MAFLMLADGTCFHGIAVGAKTHAVGEVVFNTSLFGYQEVLTDPSYFGQIINFTSPHIGNVGINHKDHESQQVHATGAVFKSFSEHYHHWQARDHLGNFLVQQNIVAISNIDTRALTLHIREHGSQSGCIVATDAVSPEQALCFAQEKMAMPLDNESASVSTKASYCYAASPDQRAHVVVIDCGVKAGILKSLASYGVKITVVPQSVQMKELNRLQPDGILLSNGPGDPRACVSLIQLTSELLQAQLPIFGICLGHQILALAAGAHIKKMKFGHHGANHPIKCLQSGTVFISSQNHGFVVDEASLPSCLTVTHVSLFDQTIAGVEHQSSPAFSFQGHPEANPGPKELGMLFKKFIEQVHHA
jgi:carbamoyl-phosphate synthase small subunit